MVPTTYLAKKNFSALVEIENKNRNMLKMVDELMRWDLKEQISSQNEKIAQQIKVPVLVNNY